MYLLPRLPRLPSANLILPLLSSRAGPHCCWPSPCCPHLASLNPRRHRQCGALQ